MSETARSDRCKTCDQYARPGCRRMLCPCPGLDADLPDVGRWLFALRHPGAACPLGHWRALPPDARRIDKVRIGKRMVSVLIT